MSDKIESGNTLSPVNKTKIGMTDLAWEIVAEESAKNECTSASEYLEWLVLSQRFSAREAASLLRLRRQRGGRGGGRGGVHVVLPTEGSVIPTMQHPVDRSL